MRTAGTFTNTLFFSGLVLITAMSPASGSAAVPEAGKIILVKGDVFILGAKDKAVVADPAGKRGRSTQKGSSFFEGETIQTKDGARVKLLFTEGGNEIVLGSSTSLVIERAGSAKPGTELSLRQGTVRSSVNRKYTGEAGDIFEVKTPNSVAGVRGTIFNVAYDNKKNMTQVLTERGSVAVNGLGAGANAKPTYVNAGMFSEVHKSETPSAPATATAAMIQNANPETNKDSKAGSSATDGSATKSDSKKDGGPSVAMAPEPADSSKADGRAPASSSGAAPDSSSAKTMGSGTAAATSSLALKPIDIVNNQATALRQAAETQLSQQHLTQGNQTEVTVKIK